MPLSDVALRALKPSAKARKVADSGGLYIFVPLTGARLWRFAYRFDGKQKTLALGAYPAVSLSDARAARDSAKQLLARGWDPSEHKKLATVASANARAATFEVVAAELLEKKSREGKAHRTLEKLRWLYDLANEGIGSRPIASITSPEVLAVLRGVEGRGQLETAKRLRAVIGEVFRYAIATGRAESDPTFALKGALTAPVVRHRPAITEPKPFGGLLRAIDDFMGQPTTKAALQLIAILFPRPGELRQAEWKEFDLAAAVWTIPATRAKMRREHRVPLPMQALDILQALRKLTGTGQLVFPGHGMSGGEGRRIAPRPMSENTLNAALRRMGFTADEMTSHGFRAAASTMLNESGLWASDAIEVALAHQDANAVRRAYARGQFWDERVKMAQWWADKCDALRRSNLQGD